MKDIEEELNTIMDNGEQYVMTIGTIEMQKYFVALWICLIIMHNGVVLLIKIRDGGLSLEDG